MRKRQQQELERLEAALLEADAMEEYSMEPEFEDELEYLEESWQQTAQSDYDIYNTDDTDVDLADYSEEVYREPSGRGGSIVLTMLAMVALSACILLLLKFLEVL